MRVALPREERRRRFQDLDRGFQFGVVPTQAGDLLFRLRRHPFTLAVVDLSLAYPPPNRLSGHAELLGHAATASPLGPVITIELLPDQTDSSLPGLRTVVLTHRVQSSQFGG